MYNTSRTIVLFSALSTCTRWILLLEKTLRKRPAPHHYAVPDCQRNALRGRNVCYSHRNLNIDAPNSCAASRDVPSLAQCKTLALAVLWQALIDLPAPDAKAFLSDPAAREFIDGILDIHPDELDAIIHQVESGELDLSRLRTAIAHPHAPSGHCWHAIHPHHADRIRAWHRRVGHRSSE